MFKFFRWKKKTGCPFVTKVSKQRDDEIAMSCLKVAKGKLVMFDGTPIPKKYKKFSEAAYMNQDCSIYK